MALMHPKNTSGQQKVVECWFGAFKGNVSKRGDVYHWQGRALFCLSANPGTCVT